jgi:hypothetical protein
VELPDRFWSKTRTEDTGYETPCVVWTGYVLPNGYGRFYVNGKVDYAHRVAYSAQRGPIPSRIDGERAVIDHRCRTRACVNVDHMEVVTNRVNILRGETVKTHCANGHEFTPENTRLNGAGHRRCEICVRDSQEARNADRRAERLAKPPKAPKTHCVNGHEFTPENTYENPAGWRECRACRRAKSQRSAAKRGQS